ncbi:MAG: tetratricopeptide repeat protein [Acidobacteria bacterium]|nr:tetratricopeptide repeat protein [Acidobacteriota bacterium]
MRIRTILVVAGAVLLIGAPAFAQEGSESLEKEARKAFNGGQFRRAALKFESAASAAGDPARKGRMLVQSAWASYNEGKRTDAQEALRRAYAASPDLEIVPDFYSPEFVKVAADVKSTLRTTPAAPSADVAELKRVARQKLADGLPEDVIHDLTYNVPREKLDAECLELLAAAYEKVGKFNEASRIRAAKGDPAKAPLPAVAPAVAASPAATAPPPPAAPSSTRIAAGAAAPAVDYLALGRAALSHGDALNAQSAANRLLEVDPQSSDAYRLLGNAFSMRGEKVLAEANLKQAIKYNEKNEGALLDLYDFYMADKNWEPALDALRRAAEINPENRDKLVALGRKARAEGDLAHAKQVFATAAAAAPKDTSILTEYASILLLMKDPDGALEPLTKAAAAEPDREIVRANLAAVLRKKGLWKEAEKEYREAIRSDPDYAPALTGLGGLLLERGQAAEAIEPLKKAVLRAPQSVDAAWALARAQRQTGALKDAADALERPLALDAPELWNEAGAIAMDRGRWDEAVIYFDKAVSRDGTVPLYKANRDKAAAAAAFVKTAAPAS